MGPDLRKCHLKHFENEIKQGMVICTIHFIRLPSLIPSPGSVKLTSLRFLNKSSLRLSGKDSPAPALPTSPLEAGVSPSGCYTHFSAATVIIASSPDSTPTPTSPWRAEPRHPKSGR